MRRRYDMYERESMRMRKYVKGGKTYRTVSTIAILGVFAAIATLVFGVSYIGLSPAVFGIALSIGILCLSLLTTLPWVRRMEQNQVKKVCIVFLSLIAVCAVLWLIAIWMVIIMVYNAESVGETMVATMLLIVKIAIILSTQLLISSFIGNMILRYGKELVIFQVVTSLAYLFIDFYITFIFLNFQVNPAAAASGGDWIGMGDLSLLGDKFMITTLVLSVAFATVSSTVIKSVEAHRMMRSVDAIAGSGIELDEDYVPTAESMAQAGTPVAAEQQSHEQRLEKLKNMYEQNLITEEEYNKKRAEILEDM